MLVVFSGAGIFVGITIDSHCSFGVSFHPLSHVVDVDHFLVADHSRVDFEANCSEHGSRLLNGSLFDNFGAWELSLSCGKCGSSGSEFTTEVIDLTVELAYVTEVVAGIVCLEFASAADVEAETADSGDVGFDGVALGIVVEVVGIELSASFSEEIDIFA